MKDERPGWSTLGELSLMFWNLFSGKRDKVPAVVREAMRDPSAMDKLSMIIAGETNETHIDSGGVRYEVIVHDSGRHELASNR